jgi:hypothetical protein
LSNSGHLITLINRSLFVGGGHAQITRIHFRNRHRTILSISTISADPAQKNVWKGTISTENGVKVVKNPAKPLCGTFAFDLEEDLKIGGDPNDAPLLMCFRKTEFISTK